MTLTDEQLAEIETRVARAIEVAEKRGREEERAAIVVWLHCMAAGDDDVPSWNDEFRDSPIHLANCIEAGEHYKRHPKEDERS